MIPVDKKNLSKKLNIILPSYCKFGRPGRNDVAFGEDPNKTYCFANDKRQMMITDCKRDLSLCECPELPGVKSYVEEIISDADEIGSKISERVTGIRKKFPRDLEYTINNDFLNGC